MTIIFFDSIPEEGDEMAYADDAGRIEIVEIDASLEQTSAGLGFSVIGTRTSGVFVKHIVGGSAAEKGGQLRIGDQLLRINEVELVGLSAEQVARIIRLAQQMHQIVQITVAHPHVANGPNGLLIYGRPRAAINLLRSSISEQSICTTASTSGTPPRRLPGQKMSIENAPANSGMSLKRSQTEDTILSNSSAGSKAVSKPSKQINWLDDLEEVADALQEYQKSNNQSAKMEETLSKTKSPNSKPKSALKRQPIEPRHENVDPRRKESGQSNGSGIRQHFKSEENLLFYRRLSEESSVPPPEILPTKKASENLHAVSQDPIPLNRDERCKSAWSNFTVSRPTSSRKVSNDELPLVAFDQLSQLSHPACTPSPCSTSSCSQRDSAGSTRSTESPRMPRSVSQGSRKLSWQCPVCLDGVNRIRKSSRKLMTTACGHVFCDKCLNDILRSTNAVCPTCRAQMQQAEIHQLFM